MKRTSHLAFLIFLICCNLNSFAQKLNTTLTYSVNKPTVLSAKTPVLIMLHGYGSNESDLFGLSQGIDGRFMTFSLRAPNARPGGGYCWYELQFLDNGEFKYDYEQVKQSRAKILAFISEACRVYKLDSTQVYVMGFSQGAIMSYELAFYAPTKVKGLLPLSGRLMKETRLHKPKESELLKLNFFVAHGLNDEVIKYAESEKATAYLKEKKIIKLTYKTYPMPHTISDAEFNDIKKWLLDAIGH